MVATFREEQLEAAKQIMMKYHSKLAYSKISVANGKQIFLTESGPMAGLVEIRYSLSQEEDLKLLKLI